MQIKAMWLKIANDNSLMVFFFFWTPLLTPKIKLLCLAVHCGKILPPVSDPPPLFPSKQSYSTAPQLAGIANFADYRAINYNWVSSEQASQVQGLLTCDIRSFVSSSDFIKAVSR